MKNNVLRDLAETSLFAALIFVSVYALRIPVGAQFIHFGNALVVVGVLLFGAKKGATAAALGLGIFDLVTGYASVAWITILESLIVCLVLYVVYEKALKQNDKTANVIAVGVLAAVTKIVLNLIKYTIMGSLVGGTTFGAAFGLSLVKILGSYGSALATIVAVPILYPIFKQILKK
ncbi:ECF transporter S component [Streptococcus gallolyticus]|nr:ECF transporter S component [Streptococcus gallolyticus]MBY5041645.1 ECF transporter S component [Streptococcus gallolyticus]